MDKQFVIERLAKLPDEIYSVEVEMLEAAAEVGAAKDALEIDEGKLILSGEITGKNEAECKAQIRSLTLIGRSTVDEAERAYKEACAVYNRRVNEFRSLQAIARLIGGAES